jgi:hypothetical protein
VGLALGLSLGSKLTAMLSLAALAATATLVVGLAWLAARGPARDRLWAAWRTGRGWLLAGLLALVVLVASDPHLYPNPLLHLGHLLQARSEAMQVQQARYPEAAIPNPAVRPLYVFNGSFLSGTALGSRGLPLELTLAALGLAILVGKAWRDWRGGQLRAANMLFFLTLLTYFGGVSVALPMAWSHYWVSTFLLGTVLSGLGAAAVVRWRLARLPALRSRVPVPATLSGSRGAPQGEPAMS